MTIKLARAILLFIIFILFISILYFGFSFIYDDNYKDNGTFVFYEVMDYGNIY